MHGHPVSARRPIGAPFAALLLVLSPSGCGDDDPDVRQYRDTGTLCLFPDTTGGTTIAIGFDVCLSCDDLPSASCSASVTGNQVAITSALDVSPRPDAPMTCPADCSFASATCELSVPSSGEYELVLFGARSTAVTLPVTDGVAPFGDVACRDQSP
jgi:hypothetical protein